MDEIKIKSYDAVISVQTSDQRLIDYFMMDRMPRSHIPAYGVAAEAPDWSIIHRDINDAGVYWTENREVIVNGVFGKHTSEHDFTFLALTLFSRCHEEKGRTTFHSSAVSDGSKTHLLLGRRGGGKSILITELTYKRGMALASAENTVVNSMQVLAGTSVISNRIPCLAKRHPELLMPQEWQFVQDYDAKSYVPPALIRTHAVLPQDIASISFVNVDDDLDVMRISSLPKHALIYELLYNSGAYVGGLGHTIMNFKQPHPDLDTLILRQNRLDLLTTLMTTIGVQELRGPTDQIADYIVRGSK